MTPARHPQDLLQLQARFASRVTAGLNQQQSHLPHDITERLRFAREQAVARRREAQARTARAAVSVGGGQLGLTAPWWQRALAMLPLVLLALGLVAIDEFAAREQLLAAADFDAQLLADDLPPAAYADPGFAEFLRSNESAP